MTGLSALLLYAALASGAQKHPAHDIQTRVRALGQKLQAEQKQRERASRPKALTVMIDPGHGGKDTGALGVRGKKEKDVALALGLSLGEALRRKGYRVVYTRKTDVHLSLRERADLANAGRPDLFVSLHTNAHARSSVGGIETYYLDVTDDAYADALVRRENLDAGTALDFILADLDTKERTEHAAELAHAIQARLVRVAKEKNKATRDLGAKGAFFAVLHAVRMPSVLIEAAFLTNPKEAQLMGSAAYRRTLAQAIADAIDDYQGTVLSRERKVSM